MSQIHILDGQNDLILDYVQADDIIDDSHRKSLEDTLETYDFIAIGNRSYTEYLEKRNRLIIPDEDGSLVEFVIYEVARYKDSEGHKVQSFAHASYLELKKAAIIYPDKQGKKRTASQHAGFALNDTGWQVGTVEASGEKTLSISEHTSPYEFLKHVAKEYGVELRFRVEHDGKQITGRYVDLLQRVGEWRGREVEFGRDLDGIRRIEKQDIVTALLGLGPEREDGTRIEVLVEDFDALERWGRVDEHGNLKHLIEPYEIQSERSEMTETEARQYTKTALNKRINTQVAYECTIVDLENVPGLENEIIRFGDTIRIKDTSFVPPLYLEARVFEQERSIKTTAKKDIKLGDFIEYTEEDVNAIWNQLKEQIKNRVSYYEMVEYTYDKLTIDDKDETYFEEGKSFAEAVGIEAKEFAVEEDSKIRTDVAVEINNVTKYADQKAQSALDQAKMYAVAKTVYDNKMQEIAEDIGKRAPIDYVDGQIVHAIDNIEVGGRNLAAKSRVKPWESGYLRDGNIFRLTGPRVGLYITEDTYEPDTEYVLSFKIRKISGTIDSVAGHASLAAEQVVFRDGVKLDAPSWSTGDTSFPDDDKVYSYRVHFKTKPVIGTTNDRIYIQPNRPAPGYIHDYVAVVWDLQLEKGNKSTEWTPPPEDVFTEIEKKADGSTVYTIEQIDNKFNNYVGITQYTADKNNIIQDLNSHGTRLAQNEKAIGLKADDTKVNQINNSLTQKIGNVEVKADEVLTRVSKVKAEVDGLEIGGKNLLFNSSMRKDFNEWAGEGVITSEDGYACGRIDGSIGVQRVRRQSIVKRIEPLVEFTISGWVKKKSIVKGTTNPFLSLYFGGTDANGNWIGSTKVKGSGDIFEIPDNRWTYMTYTFKFMRNMREMFFYVFVRDVSGSLYFRDLKLERGNRATDWTPAPEDVSREIDGLEFVGRNFALDSKYRKAEPRNTGTSSDNFSYLRYYASMDVGETYTISAKIEATHGTFTKATVFVYPDGDRYDVPIVDGKIVQTFKKTVATSDSVLIYAGQMGATRGNGMIVREVMIVKGDRATGWTPAPEDAENAINGLNGRVETAEGEIRTIAGEVSLKANKSIVDSLEKRVTTAEGELKVLPGQINAKVSKDGVIGALNLSPESVLIDFKRVKMTGELEARHIKSLSGLNINNQFIVDANGKVTIGNQRVTIDDKGIQIRRPDGAIAVDNGLMHNAYSVSSTDPHYMKVGQATGGAVSPFRFKAFQEYSGNTYIAYKGMLDGRGDPNDFQTYKDVRDSNTSSCVFQKYEFIHSARYFVVGLYVAKGAGKFSVHFFKDNTDNLTSRVYFKQFEADFSGENICIVDLGVPNFARKEINIKFGWLNSWGPASDKIEFRINRVMQTDFV